MFHTTADMKNAVLGGNDQESALRQATEHTLALTADSLIAANPDERADLIWTMGATEERVCTIPPGVDLSLFRPLDYHVSRRQLGWSIMERIVLFVGRIDPIKGIDTLIDTMPLVMEPELHYVLIGGDLDAEGVRSDHLPRSRNGSIRSEWAAAAAISERSRRIYSRSTIRRRTWSPCRHGTSHLGSSQWKQWRPARRSSPRASAG